MKYLPCGPIEELGSGGGDDIFIYSWRRENKGSHSISSLGTRSSGKAGFVSVLSASSYSVEVQCTILEGV